MTNQKLEPFVQHTRTQHQWVIDVCWAIVLVAVAGYLRVAVHRTGSAQDFTPFPNPLEFGLASLSLARGTGFTVWLFDQPYPPINSPGYPLLLVLWHWLPGTRPENFYLVGLMLGILTPAVVYWGGRHLMGVVGSLLAGLVVAFSGVHINWCRFGMCEPVAAFWVAVTIAGLLMLTTKTTLHKQPPPATQPQCLRKQCWMTGLVGFSIAMMWLTKPVLVGWVVVAIVLGGWLLWKQHSTRAEWCCFCSALGVPLIVGTLLTVLNFGTVFVVPLYQWRGAELFPNGLRELWSLRYLFHNSHYSPSNLGRYFEWLSGRTTLDFWRVLVDHRIWLVLAFAPAGMWSLYRQGESGRDKVIVLVLATISLTVTLLGYWEAETWLALLVLPVLALLAGFGGAWVFEKTAQTALGKLGEVWLVVACVVVGVPIIGNALAWYSVPDHTNHGPQAARVEALRICNEVFGDKVWLVSDFPPPMVEAYFLRFRSARQGFALTPSLHLEWALKHAVSPSWWYTHPQHALEERVVYKTSSEGALLTASGFLIFRTPPPGTTLAACVPKNFEHDPAWTQIKQDFRWRVEQETDDHLICSLEVASLTEAQP